MAERSIDEQFAELPDAIKGRLFRILDVVLGASHTEKNRARQVLSGAANAVLPEPVPALLMAMAALVMHAGAQAGQDYTTEELDGDAKPVREAVRSLVQEIQVDPELALGCGQWMDAAKNLEQFTVVREGRPSGLIGAIAHLVTVAAEVDLGKGSGQ